MVATARRGAGTGKGLSKKPSMDKSGVHGHGCVGCKSRFEDACGDPKSMHVCANCRTGRDVRSHLLIESRGPITCCRQHARPIRDEERHRYRVYQDVPWFFCPSCSRTFPFTNPAKEPTRG